MSDHLAPDDFEQIEKLLLGLLVTPGDLWEVKPRLFLGKIPENLPVELPVPEQTQVLGTLARSEAHVEIVLESELTAEEVLRFYRTRLIALGWQVPDPLVLYHPGGFVDASFDPNTTDTSRHAATFCHAASGAGLTVTMLPTGEQHNSRSTWSIPIVTQGSPLRS